RWTRGLKRVDVDDFERCLVEITLFVRVRIEEETLGATLHGGEPLRGLHGCQSLKGFLRMRPVFLRIEPTFDSSFFSTVTGFGCELVDNLVVAFFTGTAAVAGFDAIVFGSSTGGCGSGSGADTCAGVSTGKGFVVLSTVAGV